MANDQNFGEQQGMQGQSGQPQQSDQNRGQQQAGRESSGFGQQAQQDQLGGQSGQQQQSGAQQGQQGGAQQGGQQQQFDAQSGQQGGGGGVSPFADQIRPHQEVVDANGTRVGTVDHVQGDQIKLARADSPDGEHHYVQLSQVAGIEGDKVRLRERGDNDFGQEA